MPSVAVVIATRDRPELLEDALSALGRSNRSPERLVVVDSASTDPRVASVGRASGATLLRCERPGACRARNLGWSSVEEDLVAFVDDDCLVDPEWLDAIVAAFDHPSKPSFVTGQVRADVAPATRASLSVALITDADARELRDGDDPRTMGHGANMAWRRDALSQLGGFDEELGPGTILRAAEDLDLFVRAFAAGLAGYYTPDAAVVHRQWRSRADMLRAYFYYGVGSGALAVKRYRLEERGRHSPGLVRAARGLLVDEGLAPVGRALAQHYEMGAVADMFKFAGAMRGAWRARRMVVSKGHFSSMSGADRK
ncbi:MAG TPA: glycosyltransferase [Acidimicrobiales bacterium]|nr:glycosyltransferase [Acidimicrobiales bacterium]